MTQMHFGIGANPENQLPVWMKERAARRSDPATSKEAGNLPRTGQKKLVLQAFQQHPSGLTDYELSETVHLLRGTAAKRRGELVKAGIIVPTNRRRQTDTGSWSIIWVLKGTQ